MDEIPALEVGQEQIFAKSFSDGEDEIARKIVVEHDGIVIKSLDLSEATYLETIEASAFSNVPQDESDLDNYDNYIPSLTSLKFSPDKVIALGNNAFARINVDNLELYAFSFRYPKMDVTEMGAAQNPFGKAIIDNLTLKPSSRGTEFTRTFANPYEDEEWYNHMYHNTITDGLEAKNVTVAEGVTLYDGSMLYKSNVGNLTLPNSLNLADSTTNSLMTIETLNLPSQLTVVPNAAFQNCKIKNVVIPNTVTTIEDFAFAITELIEVEIPSSVTTIGYRAFNTASLAQVVIRRSNGDGITFGTDWVHYSTEVIYKP